MILTVSLNEIFKFAKASPATRNMVEGENVLNSGNIILCGRCNPPGSDVVDIYALSLQTSGITSLPHSITGKLVIKDTQQVEVQEMKCSCKAGESQSCKHVVATLLYCNRKDIESLDLISSTDKKCLWNQRRSESLKDYAPQPTSSYCCIKQDRLPRLAPLLLSKIREDFATCDLNTALSKHRFRSINSSSSSVRTSSGIMIVEENIPNYALAIVANAGASELMIKLEELQIQCNDCCIQTYQSLVHECGILEFFLKTMESYPEWQKQRQYRITGSRCYSLYTYTKENWATKVAKYFWPKYFSSKYTKHGIQFEKTARHLYTTKTSNFVQKCGLLINKQNPWLAYSADGVVIEDNKPSKLLEIKCPYHLKDVTTESLLETCKYLKLEDTKLVLRKKNQYYGQIQFGMVLMNLNNCDFVIYSSNDHSLFIINIERDEEFVKKMFWKLKHVYFEHMIQKLCTVCKH